MQEASCKKRTRKMARIMAVSLLYLLAMNALLIEGQANLATSSGAASALADYLVHQLCWNIFFPGIQAGSGIARALSSSRTASRPSSLLALAGARPMGTTYGKRASGSPSEALLKLMAEANSVADWPQEMADNIKLADRFQPMRG